MGVPVEGMGPQRCVALRMSLDLRGFIGLKNGTKAVRVSGRRVFVLPQDSVELYSRGRRQIKASASSFKLQIAKARETSPTY